MSIDKSYSQNYVLNTFLVGINKAVGVTRGILTVIITPEIKPASIVSPAKFWDTFEKRIKTKKIIIPDEEAEITCDVILLNPLDLGIMEKAFLLSKEYIEIKVYDINEVTIVK